MKTKTYKENYAKKAKKKPVVNRKFRDYHWIITVTLVAFCISLVFSFLSELTMPNANSIVAIFLIFLFIAIGIIFDMIGISVTVADLETFNSMATKKIRGARLAVKLIHNASRTSSFCNDVIGDICGIISGSAGVALSSILASSCGWNLFFTTLLITALIAAFTIGGKALGKSTAMNRSTYILYNFCKVVSFFYRK